MSEGSLNLDYSRYRRYFLNLQRWYRKPVIAESLTVSLSMLLVAFFVAFALKPTLTKIAELKTKIEESEQTLEQLETKTAALAKANIIWQQAEPFKAGVELSLPLGDKYPTLLQEIEILTQRHGVAYLSGNFAPSLISSDIINPFTSSGKLGVKVLPFTVRVSGDFLSLVGFVNNVASIDRILSIDSLSYVQDINPGEGVQVALGFSGKAYYFGDLEQLNIVIPEKR